MPVVVLGTDAVLAALPATAVQLAHACLTAGYSNVIPASWGDELIASETLRQLAELGSGPIIACSCPIVAHRLLSASADLRPVLLPLVPPPVAVARYVHALARPNRARVTYVGSCPGAIDDSIDIRMTPQALISMLAERNIIIEEQPRVFESIIPADRRRFRSQPGGLPSTDALWSVGSRRLVEVETGDLAATVAQHVLAGENVLIDAAVSLGCVCSGAVARMGRESVVAIEPPRAASPVVDERAPIRLDMHIPAASRTPVDVMAIPPITGPSYTGLPAPPGGARRAAELTPPTPLSLTTWDTVRRQTPPGVPTFSDSAPSSRPSENKERKTLPRAYIVRRRPSPRSTPIVPQDAPPQRVPELPTDVGEKRQTNPPADGEINRTKAGEAAADSEGTDSGEQPAPSRNGGAARTSEIEASAAAEPRRAIEIVEPTQEARTPTPVTQSPGPTRVLPIPQNGTAKDVTEPIRLADASIDALRQNSAPSLVGRSTLTVMRDLRDAFKVSVGASATPGAGQVDPPEGVMGSIGTAPVPEPTRYQLTPRQMFIGIAFVLGVVGVSTVVGIMVERHFNPPAAVSPPNQNP